MNDDDAEAVVLLSAAGRGGFAADDEGEGVTARDGRDDIVPSEMVFIHTHNTTHTHYT